MPGGNPILTGRRPLRLHAVIVFVATAAVATALVILNLGFVRMSRTPVFYDFEWQNGWPWVFLSRHAEIDVSSSEPEAWIPSSTVLRFHALAAIADASFAIGLLGATWWIVAKRCRSRPFQFGLRGLLLTVTVLAAMLGWGLHDNRRQQRAIHLTAESRVGFYVDQGLPHALRRYLPGGRFRLFDRITYLDIQGPNCRGDRLKPLAGLHDVAIAEFWCNEMDDDSIRHLMASRLLVCLRLHGLPNHVTDAGLRHLREFKDLRELYIGSSEVTDAGLTHLAVLERLEHLSLANLENLTDAGLVHLRVLKGLKTLYLTGTGVTDAGMNELAALPNLETLSLGGTAVTDAGLMRLSALRRLTLIDVRNTAVTNEAIARFKQAHPGCRVVQ